jgi:glycine cleavage system aminomethyltransferase T
MPVRYSSDLAEHHAVRGGAGLFDLSHMGEIVVSGPDAARALDHALAGRLSTARVGRAKYTLLCEPGGGVLDDLVGYRTGEDEYLLVVNAANTAQDLAALAERSHLFDVAGHGAHRRPGPALPGNPDPADGGGLRRDRRAEVLRDPARARRGGRRAAGPHRLHG